MATKNALAEYLKKLLKGRETAIAAQLDLTPTEFKQLLAGEYHVGPGLAIQLGALTDTKPAWILHAQTDAQLDQLGYVEPAPAVKPPKAKTEKKYAPQAKGAAIAPPKPRSSGSVAMRIP
jgi:plasmid maintenance system antidote protein VapI